MNGKETGWKNDFEKYYKDFTVSESMVEDFINVAKRNKINILETVPDKKEMAKKEYYYSKEQFDKDIEKIKIEIKYNIARQYFKERSLYPRIKAMNDKFVIIALTLFDEAKKLADI